MKTNKLNDAYRMLKSFWDNTKMYNVDIKGKNFSAKEVVMSKNPTIQDAMDAITALTKTVTDGFADAKADRELIKKDIVDIKKDIVRLDNKIDNIVALNNLKT